MPYNKITWSGTLPGGEVWSSGCSFMGNFGSLVETFDQLDEWAGDLTASFTGNVLPTELRTLIGTTSTIDRVRAEYLDDDSTLLQAAESVVTPVAGVGTPTKPFQTSVVLSLLSGVPGRSNRGRMFWPAIGCVISTSTLRLSDPTAAEVAGDAVLLLQNAVTTAAALTTPATIVPAIWSRLNQTARMITAVEVGDVLDVQRRRRDRVNEIRAQEPASW